MKIYIVEKEEYCSDCGGSMVRDSVWLSREQAEKYAKTEFSQSNWASQAPRYEVVEIEVK